MMSLDTVRIPAADEHVTDRWPIETPQAILQQLLFSHSSPPSWLNMPAAIAYEASIQRTQPLHAGSVHDYLAFFQFVHNTRKRGKALLQSLVERLPA